MAIKVDTSGFKRYENFLKNVPKDQHKQKLSEWGKKGGSKGGNTRKAHYQNVIAAENCSEIVKNFIYQSWNLAMRNVAHKIQEDIKNQYCDEVRRFYRDFGTPAQYNRTYSLFDAFKPVFYRRGNVYYIGGKLSGEYIEYTPYHNLLTSASDNPNENKYVRGGGVDPSYVFDLFYEEGSHGNDIILKDGTDRYLAEFTYPTPKEQMEDWWTYYYWQLRNGFGNFINEELMRAMRHNQSLLRR